MQRCHVGWSTWWTTAERLGIWTLTPCMGFWGKRFKMEAMQKLSSFFAFPLPHPVRGHCTVQALDCSHSLILRAAQTPGLRKFTRPRDSRNLGHRGGPMDRAHPSPGRGRKLQWGNGDASPTGAHSRERESLELERQDPIASKPWAQIRMVGVSRHGFGFQSFGEQGDFCVLQKRMAWSCGAPTLPNWATC